MSRVNQDVNDNKAIVIRVNKTFPKAFSTYLNVVWFLGLIKNRDIVASMKSFLLINESFDRHRKEVIVYEVLRKDVVVEGSTMVNDFKLQTEAIRIDRDSGFVEQVVSKQLVT